MHGNLPRILGRSHRRSDDRTLRFARYAAAIPEPPARVDWSAAVRTWRPLGNLKVGNCTATTVAHITQTWLANEMSWADWQMRLKPVMRFYSACSGYVPGRPATDVGSDMLTMMNRWRKAGMGGHRIEGYSALDTADAPQLRRAVWLMGAVPIGLWLPLSVADAIEPGSVWDVPSGGAVGDGAPGSWAGHCVPLLGYDADAGTYLIQSWLGLYTLTQAFLDAYCDEAYAPLSAQDWARLEPAPNGFDLAALRADLAALQARNVAAAGIALTKKHGRKKQRGTLLFSLAENVHRPLSISLTIAGATTINKTVTMRSKSRVRVRVPVGQYLLSATCGTADCNATVDAQSAIVDVVKGQATPVPLTVWCAN